MVVFMFDVVVSLMLLWIDVEIQIDMVVGLLNVCLFELVELQGILIGVGNFNGGLNLMYDQWDCILGEIVDIVGINI